MIFGNKKTQSESDKKERVDSVMFNGKFFKLHQLQELLDEVENSMANLQKLRNDVSQNEVLHKHSENLKEARNMIQNLYEERDNIIKEQDKNIEDLRIAVDTKKAKAKELNQELENKKQALQELQEKIDNLDIETQIENKVQEKVTEHISEDFLNTITHQKISKVIRNIFPEIAREKQKSIEAIRQDGKEKLQEIKTRVENKALPFIDQILNNKAELIEQEMRQKYPKIIEERLNQGNQPEKKKPESQQESTDTDQGKDLTEGTEYEQPQQSQKQTQEGEHEVESDEPQDNSEGGNRDSEVQEL